MKYLMSLAILFCANMSYGNSSALPNTAEMNDAILSMIGVTHDQAFEYCRRTHPTSKKAAVRCYDAKIGKLVANILFCRRSGRKESCLYIVNKAKRIVSSLEE